MFREMFHVKIFRGETKNKNRCEFSGLNGIERDIFINYLRDPTDIDPNEPIEKRNIRWNQIFDVFCDSTIWMFTLIAVANLVVIKYWAISFPHLIEAIGFEDIAEQWMTIPPFILAAICAVVGAIVATKKKEHGYCVIFFLCTSSIGFILMAALARKGQVAMYVSACLACCGGYPAFALLMAWLVCTVRGHLKKALAVSLAVSLGQLGGIIFPFISYADQIDEFRRSHIICAVAIAVAALLAFLLRFFLRKRTMNPIDEVLTNADL